MIFCHHSGHVNHMMRWLTKYFLDYLDIFHMYAEMGNHEHTKMQLRFQHTANSFVLITKHQVGGTGQYCKAANNVVITWKFCVLNKQYSAFEWGVQQGKHRVPYSWLQNLGPAGNDYSTWDLHQLFGVGQMCVLHGLMSQLSMMTSIGYWIPESCKDRMGQLTENGYRLQSHIQRSLIVVTMKYRYSSLYIQPTYCSLLIHIVEKGHLEGTIFGINKIYIFGLLK